jgi:hypothetical protein
LRIADSRQQHGNVTLFFEGNKITKMRKLALMGYKFIKISW